VKLAIMQPYFFPYLGYWQLISAADTFVIYDDVNYIKGGWVNRNRILVNQHEYMLTLPLDHASPNKLINEIALSGERERLIKTVAMAYRKAPHFAATMPLIEDILRNPADNLALLLEYSIRRLCDFIGIGTEILVSSKIDKTNQLCGQGRVLNVCARLGAKQYINSVGGKALYDGAVFREHGIVLSFLEAMPFAYEQFGGLSLPSLSIIDVLMFNSRDQVKEFLGQYELVAS
jgi:hypothetical protein